VLFLFPVRHETDHAPLVTAGLILVNAVVFGVLWTGERSQASVVSGDKVEQTARKLAGVLLADGSGLKEYDRAVVNLELSEPPVPSERLADLFKRVQTDPVALSPEARYRWDLVYPLFESYERSVQEKPGRTTLLEDYGFRPSKGWLPGLFTHQFLHQGFFHVFFNMLFLWVVGSVLEGLLGWNLVWLYLAGGAAAAAAQALWDLPAEATMLGASGAVSALMGFALLAAPGARVRFVYAYLLMLTPRYGAFDAPLWLMLPIWLFQQVFMALMTAKSSLVQTAYMAHAGGFVFGGLAAAVYRLAR